MIRMVTVGAAHAATCVTLDRCWGGGNTGGRLCDNGLQVSSRQLLLLGPWILHLESLTLAQACLHILSILSEARPKSAATAKDWCKCAILIMGKMLN